MRQQSCESDINNFIPDTRYAAADAVLHTFDQHQWHLLRCY
jgi:hypothetical protein